MLYENFHTILVIIESIHIEGTAKMANNSDLPLYTTKDTGRYF